MKLYAHVALDGRIEGLITAPDGKISAGLVPRPGCQVCEIQGHGLKDNEPEFEKLRDLIETNTVVVNPAHGKLVRRKK